MIGTPVETIVPLTQRFLPKLEQGCIVSDVGSVKGEIVRGMEKLLPNIYRLSPAIRSPAASSGAPRRRGENLFVRHRCVLTPTKKTDKKALKKVAALWRKVGADVEIMHPDTHDRVLGVISHLPHVLVYALVNALERTNLKGVDLKIYLRRRLQGFYPHRLEPAGALAGYLFDEPPRPGPLSHRLHQVSRTAQSVDSRQKGGLLEKEFARAYDTRAQIP